MIPFKKINEIRIRKREEAANNARKSAELEARNSVKSEPINTPAYSPRIQTIKRNPSAGDSSKFYKNWMATFLKKFFEKSYERKSAFLKF